MATAVEVLSNFDYSELGTEQRIIVQQRASEIKSLLRQRAQNAIEIGQKLMEVKDALGYGHYRRWLEAEFTWGKTLANGFENAAKQFANVHNVDNFDSSALRLLASPSVPEEARDEAKAIAADGDRVTHADAQAIVAKHKGSSGSSGGGGTGASKKALPDRFPVDRKLTVAEGEYAGQTVTVVESDGVTVQCQTSEGAIVPLLSAELEWPHPELDPKPAAPPKSTAPSPIELLSIELEVANNRIKFLEEQNQQLRSHLDKTRPHVPTKLRQAIDRLLKPRQG